MEISTAYDGFPLSHGTAGGIQDAVVGRGISQVSLSWEQKGEGQMFLGLFVDGALLAILIYSFSGEMEDFRTLALLVLGISVLGTVLALGFAPLGLVGGLLAGTIQAGVLVFALMWLYGLVLQHAALAAAIFFGIKLAIRIGLALVSSSENAEALRWPMTAPPAAPVLVCRAEQGLFAPVAAAGAVRTSPRPGKAPLLQQRPGIAEAENPEATYPAETALSFRPGPEGRLSWSHQLPEAARLECGWAAW